MHHWRLNSKTTEIQDQVAGHPSTKQVAWLLYHSFVGSWIIPDEVGIRFPPQHIWTPREWKEHRYLSLTSHQRPKIQGIVTLERQGSMEFTLHVEKIVQKFRRKKFKTEPNATLAGRFGQ